jgi:DNA-binding response OmpR family regulator
MITHLLGQRIMTTNLKEKTQVTEYFAVRFVSLEDVLSNSEEEQYALSQTVDAVSFEVEKNVLRFEDLSLNPCTREVFRGDRPVFLTVKEFALLQYFLSRPRQVFTRSQILDQIWGYDFVGSSNILDVYVRYLRKKLEENGEARLIHTYRGVGYSLRLL